ncbi:MAG: DEAD/DEAH box helicase family protein [Victivallaceae bacterium]
MARAKKNSMAVHEFRNKLLLNQWLISLFGVDSLVEHKINGKVVRPFHRLAENIRNAPEGLDSDNFHHFYNILRTEDFFRWDNCILTLDELRRYEENVVAHTQRINQGRQRPIVWKYFQWLSLIFTEIYLDRYFRNKEQLLSDLNAYVEHFNRQYPGYLPMPLYELDDLNKVCLQNATGSGKTLLMHINLLQFNHYARQYSVTNGLNYTFLLTPNERLSDQHELEFMQSGLHSRKYSKNAEGYLQTDIFLLEIQKLGDTDGPNTIATRNLGDNNLLLVDEGHAGISGKNAKKDEAAWMKNRAMLCDKGFSFEYSATFGQAASGTGHEDEYAKAVIFDYSYRWFYEDGYGKDYQIFNIPRTFASVQYTYLVGSLLKYYQQLLIYQEKFREFIPFNLEKPLWVFVGSTVSGGSKLSNDDKEVATDIALIIEFLADFLTNPTKATLTIDGLLSKTGQETGMLDSDNYDFFHGAFDYLAKQLMTGLTTENFYSNILALLFNTTGTGQLTLERVKGNSGEIVLKAGLAIAPFGLINVGSPKELCDHIARLPVAERITIKDDSEYTEAMFASIKDSTSPVNLLIGSKKFVEGWDCWRVSTLGLMHVGKTEGAQIIQLFGRGVRLKGYEWSLKRSSHTHAPSYPQYIEELELLNVFGIEADFMQKFRDYLRDEGLPGNERRHVERVPLNVTYGFGKKLKILRPKKKKFDGEEYDFKKDAPVPNIGDVPHYLINNPIVSDWYPRIQAVSSRHSNAVENKKHEGIFRAPQIAMLDFQQLFFAIERFKRERSWHNFNVSIKGLRTALETPGWYRLFIPMDKLTPKSFAEVNALQQIATELLRRYAEKLYDYCKREFMEPRLEMRELTAADNNIPKEKDYQLIVDADDSTLIASIQKLKSELATKHNELLSYGGICGMNLKLHLFEPLFHIKTTGQVTILPVSLNPSEFQFVEDIKNYALAHQTELANAGKEIFLLRNLSLGKGTGFFEASNFHPDFQTTESPTLPNDRIINFYHLNNQ